MKSLQNKPVENAGDAQRLWQTTKEWETCIIMMNVGRMNRMSNNTQAKTERQRKEHRAG